MSVSETLNINWMVTAKRQLEFFFVTLFTVQHGNGKFNQKLCSQFCCAVVLKSITYCIFCTFIWEEGSYTFVWMGEWTLSSASIGKYLSVTQEGAWSLIFRRWRAVCLGFFWLCWMTSCSQTLCLSIITNGCGQAGWGVMRKILTRLEKDNIIIKVPLR